MKAPLLLTVALGLAACATAVPPSPPVTSLEGKACGEALSLAEAVDTTPAKPKPQHRYSQLLSAESACATLAEDDGSSNYAVFALPAENRPHMATAGTVREPLRLVPPMVLVLNDQGEVRTIGGVADARNIGGLLAHQFRLRPDDAYIVLASDPAAVGEERERVETDLTVGTASGYAAGGTYSYNTYAGADRTATRTGSHEGKLVLILDWPRQ